MPDRKRTKTEAQEHYDRLLARHYTWMTGGDLESATAHQRELLGSLGVTGPEGAAELAIDLGAGPGPQSFALADLATLASWRSTAAPSCWTSSRHTLARGRPWSRDAVTDLLDDVFNALAPGGLFVSTYRISDNRPVASNGFCRSSRRRADHALFPGDRELADDPGP